jgi:hypothetical protein
MANLDPAKLHVRVLDPPPSQDLSRVRYTLTHSDATGDLFLSLGADYDHPALAGLLQRFMRDEVLAEWGVDEGVPVLDVHCHVSGGLILGSAGWRLSIFRHHMPQVLQAFRYGDHARFERLPGLDQASIRVNFHSPRHRYNLVESWGTAGDYRLQD